LSTSNIGSVSHPAETGLLIPSDKALSVEGWALWALILLMIAANWRTFLSGDTSLAAVMLSVLYLVAIHSVFESGGKYHEPLIGLVAVLAGQVVATPSATRTNPGQ